MLGAAWYFFIPKVELNARLQVRGAVRIENLDDEPWTDVRVRIKTGYQDEIGWTHKSGSYRAKLGTLTPGTHTFPLTVFRDGKGRVPDFGQRIVLSKRIRARIGGTLDSWSEGD